MDWSGVEGWLWLPASLPACSLAHFCGSRESDSYYGQSAIYCRHSDEHWLLSAGFVLCIVDCGVALIAA